MNICFIVEIVQHSFICPIKVGCLSIEIINNLIFDSEPKKWCINVCDACGLFKTLTEVEAFKPGNHSMSLLLSFFWTSDFLREEVKRIFARINVFVAWLIFPWYHLHWGSFKVFFKIRILQLRSYGRETYHLAILMISKCTWLDFEIAEIILDHRPGKCFIPRTDGAYVQPRFEIKFVCDFILRNSWIK